MTPAARIQAAIEVLDSILVGAPAEKALTGWARRARFAGSEDRAALRDHVFQALRCMRSHAVLGGAEAGLITGRVLMLGALREQGVPLTDIFNGAGYAPEPLTPEEAVAGSPTPDDLLDLPDWLIAEFRNSLGKEAEHAARLLRDRAPVMVRVNSARIDRAEACDMLASDGIVAGPHPIASTALHVTDGARRLKQCAAYLAGVIEMQDGSSQAAMEAVPLPATGAVLDYCAGGGGKTLALAARAGPELHWFAHDADPARMKDLPERAARAGVAVRLVEGKPDLAAPYDLVLCDVPCSGSGTWRRAPEAKWALTPERLTELQGMQAEILEQAAALVTPGGHMVYATCSVLRQENDAQIEAFLVARPSWNCDLIRSWPISEGGDGFFAAVLSCKKA